jgi:hypothetical protein
MKVQKLIIGLIVWFSFGITFGSLAQSKEKQKYSKEELEAFSKIYKHTLDFPFDQITSMQKNASKIKISEERLSEILQAQFAGNSPQLTKEEILEMEQLKKLMETDKQNYDKEIEQYIATQKITVSKYLEIKKLYNKDNKFQEKVNKMSNK